MLSDVSTRFVNLPADQIDQQIEQCLEIIAKTLHIDRCSVAQLNSEKSELRRHPRLCGTGGTADARSGAEQAAAVVHPKAVPV